MWPGRMHLAGYLARDSLRDLGDCLRSAQNDILRMSEHVDESGRYDLLPGVDGSFRGHSRERGTDIGDPVAASCNASAIPRIPGAVHHTRIRYQDVVCRCRRRRCRHAWATRRNCDYDDGETDATPDHRNAPVALSISAATFSRTSATMTICSVASFQSRCSIASRTPGSVFTPYPV